MDREEHLGRIFVSLIWKHSISQLGVALEQIDWLVYEKVIHMVLKQKTHARFTTSDCSVKDESL